MNTPNPSIQPADPQEEIAALKLALEEKSEEIKRLRAESEKPVFGEWQLCPKCAGNGQLWQSQLAPYTSIGWYNCDVCGGAKIIMRPIVPSNK